MKNILTVLFAFVLSGCMWQTVDYKALRAATELCSEYKGVAEISSYFDGGYSAKCVSGEYFTIREMDGVIYKHEMEAAAKFNEGNL